MVKKKLNVCIVGKGSIGNRHCNNIKLLGHKPFYLRSNKAISNYINNSRIEEIFEFNRIDFKKLDLAIICNPSSLHPSTAIRFLKKKIPTIIEKPLGIKKNDLNNILKYSRLNNVKCYVAYQLRCDPKIIYLQKFIRNLKKRQYISLDIEWYSYMPHWHKDENFMLSYASNKSLGGGVVPTCSHEIDIAYYLMGKPKRINGEVSRNKKYRNLDINTDANFIIKHENDSTSNIRLSFLNKNFSRKIILRTSDITLKSDYEKNYIEVIKNNTCRKIYFKKVDIYKKELEIIIRNLSSKSGTVFDISNQLDTHNTIIKFS